MGAVEDLAATLAALPEARRASAIAALDALRLRWVPQTDQELWEAIRDWCGIEIPRKAVCRGHQAPFDFVADSYFERGAPDKLAIGNRGSGKTEDVAALHATNSRTKPGYEGASAGAVESQAGKAYRYFRAFTQRPGWEESVDQRHVTLGRSVFKNGATIEIVVGTLAGVNSPHPHTAHLDEIELLRPGVYQEALNMAQSSLGYRGQNLLTSSWKLPRGLITEIKTAVEKALREQTRPSHDVYHWCVYETTEPCPHDCDACPFADVVKGQRQVGLRADGTPIMVPRTFEWTCKRESPVEGRGKLKLSAGFQTLGDAVRRFAALSPRMWESQQESRKPTAEGLVYDCFDEAAMTCERWEPDPSYGDIILHADFGGTNPFAIGFWQVLRVDVILDDVRYGEGTWVLFDEIYTTETTGNVEVGRQVNDRLTEWGEQYPGFMVTRIWRDPAAKAAAEDWKKLPTYGAGPTLETRRTGGLKVEDRIGLVYDRIVDGRVIVDATRCHHFLDEIGGYEQDPMTGKPVKEDDHHMDGMGYAIYGEHRLAGHAPTPGEVRTRRSEVRQQADGGAAPYDLREQVVPQQAPIRFTQRVRTLEM